MALHLLLLLLQLLLRQSAAPSPPPPLTETSGVAALLELRRLVGPRRLPTWVGNDPCGSGTWSGVSCQGGAVTSLQLAGARLSGPLPSSFSMPSLRILSLQGNNFTSIPSSFFRFLPSLTSLSLDYSPLNSSTGGWSLPPDVADLRHLQSLSLTSTFLAGPLPDFLASMPNLRHLHLAYNRLYGRIPPSFAKAPLFSLQLNNQLGHFPLSGPIDPVGSMPSLSLLWLHVNSFSGPLPRRFASASTLSDLRLNDNQLVGTIPPSLVFSATSLYSLSLQHNHLQGSIPRFPSLSPSNFTFQGNAFCSDTVGGTCSPAVNALLDFLAALQFPDQLSLSWPGGDPCSAAWSGVACGPNSTVTSLSLPRRRLSGTLSPSLAHLSSLQVLILDNNNLTGPIPPLLATLPSLRRLSLRHNNFLPPLPSFRPGLTVDLEGNPQLTSGSGAAASPPTTATPPPIASSLSSSGGSIPLIPPSIAAAPPPDAAQVEGGRSGGKRASVAGGVLGALSAVLVAAAVLAVVAVKRRQKKRRELQERATSLMSRSSGGRLLEHPSTTTGTGEVVKCTVENDEGTLNCVDGDGVQTVEAGDLVISIQVLRDGGGRSISEESRTASIRPHH